ncbi:zinc finger protein [Aphelenchoides avenae]|nr:zinc finger protein [Aphelenchus avenae]
MPLLEVEINAQLLGRLALLSQVMAAPAPPPVFPVIPQNLLHMQTAAPRKFPRPLLHRASAPTLMPSLQRPSLSSAMSTPRGSITDCLSGTSSPGSNISDSYERLNKDDGQVWCRNKKYIEPLKKGYRCTVCNKVYGRYNSVSYHVTIYHRNPPIKCDQPNCKFSTREARYIHFHRLYKHGIPLPSSIDLASRKCPFFGCKHIAKSPAMLEKHMVRHAEETVELPPDATRYKCQACPFATNDHEETIAHLKTHMSTPGKENISPVEPLENDEIVNVDDSVEDITVAALKEEVARQVPLSFSAEFLANLA